MRTLTQAESGILDKPGYNAYARVQIADADDAFRDYGDLPVGSGLNWVLSVEWAENNDQPTMVATVRLARAHWNLSLAPLQDSRLNRKASGAFGRLLDIGRTILIDAAVGGSDAGPGAWVRVFRGRILEVDWGQATDNEVVVTARDDGGRVLDRFIEVDKLVYSTPAGTAVETVMQAILDANTVGEPIPPLVIVTGAPGWNIRQFQQERMGALEAVRRLAQQIGWDIRYRWQATSFELNLYEPPRVVAVTADRRFTREEYFSVSQQRYSLEDLRNVIQIPFTEKLSPFRRQVITVSDAPSIAAYGRRFMEVAEAATSGIDTTVEATRMANAILDDLKEPRSFITLVTSLFYPAQLGDTIEIDKDGITFDQAIKILVYGVRHRIEGNRHSTEWTGRQAGGGYRDRWMESEVRPGIAPRQDLAVDSNSMRATRITSAQVIPPNVATTIVYNGEQYDVGALYNPATGIYVVPSTGLYELSAGAVFLATQVNVTSRLLIFRNGALQMSGDRVSQAAGGVNVFLALKSLALTLTAGDTIDVRLSHDMDGNANVVVHEESYLTVRKLRGG